MYNINKNLVGTIREPAGGCVFKNDREVEFVAGKRTNGEESLLAIVGKVLGAQVSLIGLLNLVENLPADTLSLHWTAIFVRYSNLHHKSIGRVITKRGMQKDKHNKTVMQMNHYAVVEEVAVGVVEVDFEVVGEKRNPLSLGPTATPGHRKNHALLDGVKLRDEVGRKDRWRRW